MFKLRLTTDCQPRTKNGQPPQSTTGVASTSSAQINARGAISLSSAAPGTNSLMAAANKGTVRARPTQNRRVMLTSSGFSSSSRVTTRGSSAIPQIGHDPGSERTISGCIGHTYSVFTAGAEGTTGSSAMPHFGPAPGPCWTTLRSIGQVYSRWTTGVGAVASWTGAGAGGTLARAGEIC